MGIKKKTQQSGHPQYLENPEARRQDFSGGSAHNTAPGDSAKAVAMTARCAWPGVVDTGASSDLVFPSRLCSDNDFLNSEG